MKGVSSANVIFDVRINNPQKGVLHLNPILDTYKNLVSMGKDPVFALVFMDGAVKLISSDHSGFGAEDQKSLKFGKSETKVRIQGQMPSIRELAA